MYITNNTNDVTTFLRILVFFFCYVVMLLSCTLFRCSLTKPETPRVRDTLVRVHVKRPDSYREEINLTT